MQRDELEQTARIPHIYEAIRRQKIRTPYRIAVSTDDRSLTYAEVLDFADEIARILGRLDLGPEQPVAIYMKRDAELPSVLLGIMKAGGAFIPIDLYEPPERIGTMLRLAGCEIVIGDSESLATLASQLNESVAAGLRFLDVASISPDGTEANTKIPSEDHLAYLIFTSGSTGAPKAVEVTHRSLMNVLNEVESLFEFNESDRFLAVSTLAFDISLVELFLPLMVGAQVILRDSSCLLDLHDLKRIIRDNGVTTFQTGPSVWSVIDKYAPDFPKLRVAITTGEAVSRNLAVRLPAYAEAFWNMYGPTETTIWVTAQRLDTGRTQNKSLTSASIGNPIGGVQLRIENPGCAIAEDGQPGELLVSGKCLARGYRGSPELTKERFVVRNGTRFYRTGDIVCQTSDRGLDFIGRIDDQINIQGRRVEPREIESLLEQFPEVSQAASTWLETGFGTRAILAAVVWQPNLPTSLDKLRVDLADKLPKALVPAKLLIVDKLPITNNGKVDRTAIRAMASSINENQEFDVISSLTQTEILMVKLWKQTLKSNDITIGSHFFEAGGDSLAAVILAMTLEKKLNIIVPSQLILETPVLTVFASQIDAILANDFAISETSFIFPLQHRENSRPVFFCGADLGLARDWGLPCSLYVIAYWAAGGKMVEVESIQLLAARYIKGIRSLQQNGPYRIAGYSWGAILALEISQQLQKSGQEVEILFLLDPFKLSRINDGTQTISTESSRFKIRKKAQYSRFQSKVRRGGVKGLLLSMMTTSRLKRIIGVPWLTYHLFHLRKRYPNILSEKFLPRKMWPIFWYDARRKAAEYAAESYQGRSIVVFTPEQGGQEEWAKILGGHNEVVHMRVEHGQFFEPTVARKWQVFLGKELSD